MAALTFFCAFILPFLFPGNQQVYSAAYTAGANNKLATVALALLCALTLLWTVWASRTEEVGEGAAAAPLSWPLLLSGTAAVVAWTAWLSLLVTHSGLRYGESGYFLERMRDVAEYGSKLYTGIEFPYGPLLILPPVWLAHLLEPLHASLQGCFFCCLTLLNAAGVLMAGFCLNRLPLGRPSRIVLFLIFCFEQTNPVLGPNYSLGKFVLPFAVLLYGASRSRPWRQATALACGHLLVVMVSPELGVGLAAGIAGWAALAAWRMRSATPLVSWLAPVAGYGVFLGLYGRGFLDRLGHASAGALNLIIEPRLTIYIFLAAAVWLAPIAVGLRLRGRNPHGPVLLGVLLLSLGLLPGALGRADPIHIFFNGLGFLMLSSVGLERLGRTRATLWLLLLTVLAVEVEAVNFQTYLPQIHLLEAQQQHGRPAPEFDAAALKRRTGGAPVATPALFTISLADELALRRAGLFQPDYAAGMADLWDRPGEEQKIARLRQQDWALLPAGDFRQAEGSPNENRLKRMLRFGYRYPVRRTPFVVGLLVEQELTRHWVPVEQFGDVVLWRKVR